MAYIIMFEELVSFIFNGVSEGHHFCKLFPSSLAGNEVRWFKKFPPGSLTAWNDITNAFLNIILYNVASNLEIKMKFMLSYQIIDPIFFLIIQIIRTPWREPD